MERFTAEPEWALKVEMSPQGLVEELQSAAGLNSSPQSMLRSDGQSGPQVKWWATEPEQALEVEMPLQDTLEELPVCFRVVASASKVDRAGDSSWDVG